MERREGVRPVQIKTRLAELMWNQVGIFRNRNELHEAVLEIEKMQKEQIPQLYVMGTGTRYNHELIEALEVDNMVLTAEMIARAALMREESRGAHFQRDFPKTDNKNWFVNITVREENGKMTFKKNPVVLTMLKPAGT